MSVLCINESVTVEKTKSMTPDFW